MSEQAQIDLPLNGSCQCGGVSYQVNAEPMVTVACHCLECQKLSASAFSLTMVLAKDSLNIQRGELSVYERPADLGGTALCYFCSTCGNRVYHENPNLPSIVRLKPGGLEDNSQIAPQAHVWISRAQPWFKFSDGIATFETQPDLKDFLAQN